MSAHLLVDCVSVCVKKDREGKKEKLKHKQFTSGQIHAFPAPLISPPSTRLALIPYKSATYVVKIYSTIIKSVLKLKKSCHSSLGLV